jgi:uncharacterized repeat protein (TIGR01451 family)
MAVRPLEIPVKRFLTMPPLLLALAIGAPLSNAHAVEVFEVQGNGMTSPLVGQSVTIHDSVVTAVFNGGFFLQTPDARGDEPTALTSNGIRVITAGMPTYANSSAIVVGDRATVQGTVLEQQGETRLQMSSATQNSSGNALPATVEFSLQSGRPRADFSNLFCFFNVSNFECFEGMRVSLPDAMVVAGNVLGTNDYGPVYVSPYGLRSLREKGVRFDDELIQGVNEQAGIWDSNPEILRMEFDRFGALPANTALVGGARFSATGILTVVDGSYTFWPTQIAVDAATNTLPVSASIAETASSFRIATFDLGALCSSAACSAAVPLAGNTNRLAAYITEALGSPEVVAVQHVETQAALDALANAASNLAPAGATYAGYIGSGGDANGLRLGYLIRTDKISSIVVSNQLAGNSLHPKPPLLLQASFASGGDTHTFRVLNVHVDPRDGIENDPALMERRFQQSLSIAQLIQSLQTTGPQIDNPLMVVGKLNGWTQADGYVDVHGMLTGRYFDPENKRNLGIPDVDNPVSPIMTSIMKLLPHQDQISTMTFVDFGAVQGESRREIPAAVAFDHILLARDARRTTTEYGVARANADAPEFLRLSGSGAVGSSPYDGVVVRMYPGCLTDPAANQDGDGWCDTFDNCPTVANEDQIDFNGNGVGDACEAAADIALALTATPNPAEPAQNVTVNATISHLSGDAVQNLVLTLELPRRFTVQSVIPGAWTCGDIVPTSTGDMLECTRASLASGNSTVSFVGVPDADLPTGATLRVSGSVTPVDANMANNTAVLDIAITGIEADLALFLENPSPLATIGQTLQFGLTLNNLSGRTAQNVIVQMHRPPGTELATITPNPAWTCDPAGASATQLLCTRGSNAVGDQTRIDFTLTVLPSAGTTFTVNPSISSSTPDPDPSNNSKSVTFTVSDGSPEGDVIFRDGFEG